jgi:C1A family cysteine protease
MKTRSSVTIALSMLAVAAIAVVAGPADAAGTASSPAPSSAQVPHYGLGAIVSTHPDNLHSAVALRGTPKALPSSYSLAQYAPTPGDQGPVNSCVSWATAHSAMGLLENEQQISGGPLAPMYIYSQLVHGQNVGTYVDSNLDIARSQGVDTESDYTQGDFNYTNTPTSTETANAANWRISGFTSLSTGSALQTGVESAIASGLPVIFSFQVYRSFESMSAQTAQDYSYAPQPGDGQPLGGHEITIVGYSAQGVQIENSWGAGWGNKGFVNFSWQYLESAAEDAHSVGKLVQS